jgi:tetratricopeptide (TPR) repeat protein
MGDAYERGRLLFRQGRYKRAADEFRRELSADVGSANAHAMLGMSLLNTGDRSGAEAAMREAARLGPGLPYPHYALACLTVRGPAPPGDGWFSWTPSGRLAATRRRLVAARQHVSTAIEIDPRNPDFFALLAGIEYDLRLWQSAEQAARKGLTVNPLHARCKTLLGRALAMSGRSAEAGQAFRQVLQHHPENADAHMAQGWHRLRAGRPRQAAEHFRESLRLDPTQPGAKVAMRHVRWWWFPPYALRAWWLARPRGRQMTRVRLGILMASVAVAVTNVAGSAGTALATAIGAAILAIAGLRWVSTRLSKEDA